MMLRIPKMTVTIPESIVTHARCIEMADYGL